MKKKSIAVGYPTIPIIFVAGVREGTRIPAHNTMGIAVTDMNEETRTETKIEANDSGKDVFFLNGEEIEINEDMRKIINVFREKSGQSASITIRSDNHRIYSGSSDSGMAALVFALNDFFETGLSTDEIAEISMIGSESSIRSVYGGLNEILVDGLEKPKGELIASNEDLKDIRIFALCFDKPGRYSAREIFETNQSSYLWKTRMEFAPFWEEKIIQSIKEKNMEKMLRYAQENCMHAHFLFELSGKRMHDKDMTRARIDVDEIRLSGLPCYWTAGGGNVINVFSFGEHAPKVRQELVKRGWNPIDYKVASGAKVVKSE